MHSSYKISNYKISLKAYNLNWEDTISVLKTSGLHTTIYNNFLVFKTCFIFTIFKPQHTKVSHINITKIKKRSKIIEALNICNNLIKANLLLETLKIDNITASAFYGLQNLDLEKFFHANCKSANIKYNRDKFPGAFVKTSRGTALAFHSGKVVFVGCKNKLELKCLLKTIKRLIKQYKNAHMPIV